MAVLAILALAPLYLAAATPIAMPGPAGADGAAQRSGGAKVSVQVSATILRAETSSPETGPGAAARQVRAQGNGQVLVEFF